jgi:hypothetical protein
MTLAVRIAFANLPHRLDAFHDRHPQIEQRHVRVVPLEGLYRFEPVRRHRPMTGSRTGAT